MFSGIKYVLAKATANLTVFGLQNVLSDFKGLLTGRAASNVNRHNLLNLKYFFEDTSKSRFSF